MITYEFDMPTDSNTHIYSSEDLTDPSDEGPGDVTNDSSMKIIAPSGWSFDTTGWPQKLKDKLKSGDTIIELDGVTIREYWTETLGQLDEIKIKKGTSGDGGDGTDGKGEDKDEGTAAIVNQPYFLILIIVIIIVVIIIIAVVAMRKKKKAPTRAKTKEERTYPEERPEPKAGERRSRVEKPPKERLTELKKLKEDGLISDDEFERKKEEILKEL